MSNNGAHYVILEMDERQHKDYNKECSECSRMVNISKSLHGSGSNARYNPNKYKKEGKNKNPCQTERTIKLKETLNDALLKQINKIKDIGYLSFIQLFYDDYNKDDTKWTTIQGFQEKEI